MPSVPNSESWTSAIDHCRGGWLEATTTRAISSSSHVKDLEEAKWFFPVVLQ